MNRDKTFLAAKAKAAGLNLDLCELHTFESFRVSQLNKTAFDLMANWIPGNRGFLLSGSVGCGKSHLAIALVSKFVLAEGDDEPNSAQMVFVNVARYMSHLKDRMRAGGYFVKAETFGRIPTLVIDDLGAEKSTEFSEGVLEEILSLRFDSRLPTFATTNLTRETMASALSDRLSSRIMGLCDFVEIAGDDGRQVRGRK